MDRAGDNMHKHMARRAFLKSAGAMVGEGMGWAARGQAAETNASKLPRMLAGCCAYSYRELLTHGQMTLEDFILKAVELRLDAVDMTLYYLKSTDAAYLDGLRHLAYENAVAFSGAACGASMVQADAAKRADVLEQIKKWVDVTDRLGASHLRVFAGPLPAGVRLQQAVDWVVETMKAASDYSAAKGIALGVEDHAGITQNADVCLEIMERVGSPYARINLDITNFIAMATQDVYAQIAACASYAHVTHIRDHFPDHTPVDMDRVWRILAEAGFRGTMSVEYEPSFSGGEPAETGAPKLIAKTRELCRKYSSV
jgi:sugar phosphate isomerase/epimerase